MDSPSLFMEKLVEEMVDFLIEFKWIYDFPVIEIFYKNVLEDLPEHWKQTFSSMSIHQLNNLAVCQSEDYWPSDLKLYLQKCKSYSLNSLVSSTEINNSDINILFEQNKIDIAIPNSICMYKVPQKKQHEVLNLICLLKSVSSVTNTHRVLDIGSGLGYIGILLHGCLGFTVLGVEGNPQNVQNAETLQCKKLGIRRCPGLTHVVLELKDDPETDIKSREMINILSKKCVICSCSMNNNSSTNKNMRALNKSTDTSSFNNNNLVTISPIKSSLSSKYSVVIDNNINRGDNSTPDTDGKKICDVAGDSSSPSTSMLDSGPSKINPNINGNVMLTGLHACGDLSPILMKTFITNPTVNSLVLLSCCYHKLKINNDQEVTEGSIQTMVNNFDNFPMSKLLRNKMKNRNFSISVYGLRLAAQECGRKWMESTSEEASIKEHKQHERNVAYRALLEVICKTENLQLRKRKRRCTKPTELSVDSFIKSVNEDYLFNKVNNDIEDDKLNESYLFNKVNNQVGNIKLNESSNITCNNYTLNDETNKHKTKQNVSSNITCHNYTLIDETNKDKTKLNESLQSTSDYYDIERELKKKYKCYQHLFDLIEPFTGLQHCLQRVIESLVFLDRLIYFKELDSSINVSLINIFNEVISPRNVALVALKNG